MFPACDLAQNFLYFLLFLEEVGFAFQLNIISTIASDQFNIIDVNAAVYLIAVSTGHSVRSIHEVWTFYVLEYWKKKDNLKKDFDSHHLYHQRVSKTKELWQSKDVPNELCEALCVVQA